MVNATTLTPLLDRGVFLQQDDGMLFVLKGPVSMEECHIHINFYEKCPDGCLQPTVMQSESAYYLRTPFVPGGDLFDFLQRMTTQYPEYMYGFWDTKLKMITKMIYILHRLQQLGVMHRDISTENFVVHSDEFAISLIDFGLSKSANSYTDHVVCGKQGYIAPELYFPAAPGYNPFGVDAYALGICVFYLVFGFAPYERVGDHLFCTLVEHGLSGLYTVLSIDTTKIPSVFLRLLDGLIRGPESRYTMEMCADLLRTEPTQWTTVKPRF
jgi:serine/threonine protein kinase